MNYSFRKGLGASKVFVGSLTTAGTITINGILTGTNLYADGTPVRVTWLDSVNDRPRGIFGIYNDATETVTYDANVYTGADVTFADGGLIQALTGSDLLSVDTYTLQSEISLATYSVAHTPYYSNVDYSVRIPRLKGDAMGLINLITFADVTAPDDNVIVFIDRCDGYCYSVRPTVETVDSINNSFAQTLEFNVNKR
jgi:hypothetical protein